MQKITLLLDLDDTLLDTNISTFIPAYFSALSTALADMVLPEVMLPALIGGTKAMTKNTDPALSLRDVFDAYFFPKLGNDRQNLNGRIEEFYDTGFPALSHVTTQKPKAIEFVNWAFSVGHRVAIATNPYFPLKAVQHRLRWAGLPPEEYQFSLVSAYESFHFTKEQPAYFSEVLGQMGWPDAPVVMVGNDPEMDLVPARKAGLPVYWIRDGKNGEHSEFPQGSFNDLKNWLNEIKPEEMGINISKPEALLGNLCSTPAVLKSLLDILPASEWGRNSKNDEWVITEIVCHLRDVEKEVNLPRIEKILKEKDPFMPGVTTDEWAKERNYRKQNGKEALLEFVDYRKKVLGLLGREDENWVRTARHALWGSTTLRELAGFVAKHDRIHIQQAWKMLHE